MKQLKEGSIVIHHGRAHEVTGFVKHAIMDGDVPTSVEFVTFENERYKVKAKRSDFSYDENIGFFLKGRILSRNERALLEAVIGSWPRADAHAALLGMLDGIDLAAVDLTRFAEVLGRRKQDARMKANAAAADAAGDEEVPEVEAQALLNYAKDAIKQIAELRAARKEG
jgi:hypothetical protein